MLQQLISGSIEFMALPGGLQTEERSQPVNIQNSITDSDILEMLDEDFIEYLFGSVDTSTLTKRIFN